MIIANKIPEGTSLIDVQVFTEDGRVAARPTKQAIDKINATPYLDRESLRNMVAKEYGLPLKNVSFFE